MTMRLKKHPAIRHLAAALVCTAAFAAQAQVPAALIEGEPDPLYAGITHVEVFANAAMPIEPGGLQEHAMVVIYRVDGLQMMEQEINVGLPQTEAEALAWMRDNETAIRARYEKQALNAAQGMSKVISYQLTRIPAAVVNHTYVVYGMTNLDAVAEQFQLAQQAQKAAAAKKGATP